MIRQKRGTASLGDRNDLGLMEADRQGLSVICDTLRSHLGATGAAVWGYYPDLSAVSTVAVSASRQASETMKGESSRTYLNLGDFPLLERALATGRAFRAPWAVLDHGRSLESAEGTGQTVWCGPLLLGRPVGAVLLEPAARVPARLDARTRKLLAAAAAELAWIHTDRMRAQAELFLELAASSGRQHLGAGLARACEGLAQLLGMRRATVFLASDDKLVPRMSRLAGGATDPVSWEAFRNPPEPLVLAEEVLRSGSPMVAEDPGSPLIAGWWSTTFSVGAALGAPIRSDDTILGVLVVDTDRPRLFTDSYMRLVEAVATQLGGVLAVARQAEEQERRLVEAAALSELFSAGLRATSVLEAAEAVARTTKEVLRVEAACTYLVDKTGRISSLAAVGIDQDRVEALRHRLIGELASGSPVWQQTVAVSDLGPHLLPVIAPEGQVRPGGLAHLMGLRSLVAIPLMSSDGALGVVACGDISGPRAWRASDRDLLVQLALSTTTVIDNARLREAERHLALHDDLTGLSNRRAFNDQLDLTLARARRTGEHVAVLLADLDSFKEVNDTYGHPQGDALLTEVAQRLRLALRDSDMVARVGGDEFAALLSVTGPGGGTVAAERVTEVLRPPVVLAAGAVQVKASIGIACWPEHGAASETLLLHADQAMYAAKNSGVSMCLYDPPSAATPPRGVE